jgi:hypothetical protein
LSHYAVPFLYWVFLRYGLLSYLPRLTLNRDPPDLCLLSSLDYRCETLVHSSSVLSNVVKYK